MTSKLIQKFLIFLFTAVFFVILVVGIGRAGKIKIRQIVVPEPPASTTPSAPTIPTASAVLSNPNPAPVIPTAPTAPVATPEPPITRPAPIKQTPKNLQFTGTSYRTPWGRVTVVINMESGKITSVETPDYPESEPSVYARPYLIDQALQANSANIQGISGATYTSLAFQRSLESALVSAGL